MVMPIDRAVPAMIFSACLDVVGVEVGHLLLGDLAQLGLADRADLVVLRGAGALGHAGGLDQQAGGGRGLQDERERAVLVDADLGRHDVAALGLGLRRCTP